MKCIKTILRLPFKIALYGLLIGVGVALAIYRPALGKGCERVRELIFGSDKNNYNLQEPWNPVEVVDYVDCTKDRVGQRLKEAQVIVGKSKAAIAFWKDQCSMIEARVPRDANDSRSGEEILTQLAKAEENQTISNEERAFFICAEGPLWSRLRRKIIQTEQSLEQLYAVEKRVGELRVTLEGKRQKALKLLPERIPLESERPYVTPEIMEARELLNDVHETLFKAVYILESKRPEENKVNLAKSEANPAG